MREIVLDTETTGLDPNAGHRLVELGCVELINHFPSGQTFHHYIDPERDVPSDAERVHGISTAFLKGKPLFSAIAESFLEFIGDSILIIHNASFDIGFINAELQRVGRPPIGFDRVVDTLALARRKHPGAQASLDALCKRYQIDNSNRTKHGALLDSELLAEVYLELIGGHQAKLDLATEASGTMLRGPKRVRVSPRPVPLATRLTAEELAAHRTFVDSLGNEPLWSRYWVRADNVSE
ncbi:MAG: DNA polymerase III subunit epsilon [Hyphomicrobiaceae bacterium]